MLSSLAFRLSFLSLQVILFNCLGLSGDEGDLEDGNCPLTQKLRHDWEVLTEEAEELGWYEDSYVQIDAVSGFALKLERLFSPSR